MYTSNICYHNSYRVPLFSTYLPTPSPCLSLKHVSFILVGIQNVRCCRSHKVGYTLQATLRFKKQRFTKCISQVKFTCFASFKWWTAVCDGLFHFLHFRDPVYGQRFKSVIDVSYIRLFLIQKCPWNGFVAFSVVSDACMLFVRLVWSAMRGSHVRFAFSSSWAILS